MSWQDTLQVVIDKTTKEVKRSGYTDFVNDGSFDSDTEEVIEKDFIFKFDKSYKWDEAQDTFIEM